MEVFVQTLSNLLTYLSKTEYWHKIEDEISRDSIEAYELPEETVRVDATTVSGYHEVVKDGIFQFGYSKGDPNLPQIKIMLGSLDPLGMPLATDVVSGERADDKLYAPIISRISSMIRKKGLLYVGDCKLSSLENRLHIKKRVDGHYLCPLPHTGKIPEEMEKWVEEGIKKEASGELTNYIIKDEKGKEELKAKGYEIERDQSGEIDGEIVEWKERLLIIKSPTYERQKIVGKEKRLKNAEENLYALTPKRGRGKKQITDEVELIKAAEGILKSYDVEGILSFQYEKEVERKEKYVGKGRGSANRERKIVENIRYQITMVSKNEEKIKEEQKKYGWRAYVTDVSKDHLDFVKVVKYYRKQYTIERDFNRLKSRVNISPLYVKRPDQITGLTHILMLGIRVYTMIEFIVRRSLKKSGEKLIGLHLESHKKETEIPTCERILKAFSKITLTIIEQGSIVLRHLTPLSQLQINILKHLGLSSSIYNKLEIKQMIVLKTE